MNTDLNANAVWFEHTNNRKTSQNPEFTEFSVASFPIRTNLEIRPQTFKLQKTNSGTIRRQYRSANQNFNAVEQIQEPFAANTAPPTRTSTQ